MHIHAHAVEVVSAQQKIKDGRTVRQLLIDTYAENEKKEDKEGHAGNNGKHSMEISEIEKESVKDMKHGKKFPTPFYQQTYVLAKRTFIQRRGDLLGWDRIFLILTISVLAGLLWLRRDTTGTRSTLRHQIARSLRECIDSRVPLRPRMHTEDQIADRSGFLFFSTMFWIMQTWFNALFACTHTSPVP
jgi:hypothetical protein